MPGAGHGRGALVSSCEPISRSTLVLRARQPRDECHGHAVSNPRIRGCKPTSLTHRLRSCAMLQILQPQAGTQTMPKTLAIKHQRTRGMLDSLWDNVAAPARPHHRLVLSSPAPRQRRRACRRTGWQERCLPPCPSTRGALRRYSGRGVLGMSAAFSVPRAPRPLMFDCKGFRHGLGSGLRLKDL